MTSILLVADRDATIDRVHAALSLPDTKITDHRDPETAAETAYSEGVDVVVVDMQVASMGAMAVTRSIRAFAGSDDPIPVTILLDREADAFLAGRSGARNWLLKDVSAAELRNAVLPQETTP